MPIYNNVHDTAGYDTKRSRSNVSLIKMNKYYFLSGDVVIFIAAI